MRNKAERTRERRGQGRRRGKARWTRGGGWPRMMVMGDGGGDGVQVEVETSQKRRAHAPGLPSTHTPPCRAPGDRAPCLQRWGCLAPGLRCLIGHLTPPRLRRGALPLAGSSQPAAVPPALLPPCAISVLEPGRAPQRPTQQRPACYRHTRQAGPPYSWLARLRVLHGPHRLLTGAPSPYCSWAVAAVSTHAWF